jgi:hypothetical protein
MTISKNDTSASGSGSTDSPRAARTRRRRKTPPRKLHANRIQNAVRQGCFRWMQRNQPGLLRRLKAAARRRMERQKEARR